MGAMRGRAIAGLALVAAIAIVGGPSTSEGGPDARDRTAPPPYGIRDVVIADAALPAGWKKLPPGPLPADAKAARDEIRASARAAGRKIEIVERSYSVPGSVDLWAFFVQVEGDATEVAKATVESSGQVGRTYQELGAPSRFLVATGPDATRAAFVASQTAYAVATLVRRADPPPGSKAPDAATRYALALAVAAIDPLDARAHAIAGLSDVGALRISDARLAASAIPHLRAALGPDVRHPLEKGTAFDVEVALGNALLSQEGGEVEARGILERPAAEASGASPRVRASAAYHLARSLARLRDAPGAFARLEQALAEALRSGTWDVAGRWGDEPDFSALRSDPRWGGLEERFLVREAAFPGRTRHRELLRARDPAAKALARAWLESKGAGIKEGSEAAIGKALRWLAAHQKADGGWSCAGFGSWCDGKERKAPTDGPGKSGYDVGVTSLALLAFLGAGTTDRDEDPEGHHRCVAAALAYLEGQQDKEGCVGHRLIRHYIYNHAAATLALVEAYGMAPSRRRRVAAQKALDFVAIARNPYFAWRYGVKPGDNDTSVTTWMTMALRSARRINAAEERGGRPPPLLYDEDAFEGVKSWVDKMTDPDYGRVGYLKRGESSGRVVGLEERFPVDRVEAGTAEGLCLRLAVGQTARDTDVIGKGVALLTRLPPRWDPNDGSIDFCYWYFGTLALREIGGDAWTKWQRAFLAAVLPNQRMDGEPCDVLGSWDPIDAWGEEGGRVYATAILALTLETPFRYAGD